MIDRSINLAHPKLLLGREKMSDVLDRVEIVDGPHLSQYLCVAVPGDRVGISQAISFLNFSSEIQNRGCMWSDALGEMLDWEPR